MLEARREAHLQKCRCRGRLPPASGDPARAAPAATPLGSATLRPGGAGEELLALFACSAGLDLSAGQRVRILVPWRAMLAPRLGPVGTGPGPPVVFVLRAEPL